MQRKKKNKNIDPLKEQIVRPISLAPSIYTLYLSQYPAALAVVQERVSDYVLREKVRKLFLLAKKYGVDVSHRADYGAHGPWLTVCFCLAEEYVKGFKVVDTVPRGKGAPRKDYYGLLKAVKIRTRRGESVRKACRQLSRERAGPWLGENPRTLENRYYDELKKLRDAPREVDPSIVSFKKSLREAVEQAVSATQRQLGPK
jgi:hypothetical protein